MHRQLVDQLPIYDILHARHLQLLSRIATRRLRKHSSIQYNHAHGRYPCTQAAGHGWHIPHMPHMPHIPHIGLTVDQRGLPPSQISGVYPMITRAVMVVCPSSLPSFLIDRHSEYHLVQLSVYDASTSRCRHGTCFSFCDEHEEFLVIFVRDCIGMTSVRYAEASLQ